MEIKGNGVNDSILYHDNSALATIKNSGEAEALGVVAGQFEAMFLQMVLRQMRSSSDVLAAEDSPFSSKKQSVFRDFHDGQLSIELARQRTSGIAEMLVKQLSPKQLESIAAVVEPANSALDVQHADQVSEAQLDRSSKTTLQSELNDELNSAAYDLEKPLVDAHKEAMTTVAFQQPLIRKMEL